MKATKGTWVILLVILAAQQLLGQGPSRANQLAAKRPTQSYGLPLMFEKNQGQTDSQVQFLSRGNGYSVYLTAGGMVLGLCPEETASGLSASHPHLGPAAIRQMERASRGKKSVALTIDLVGAARNPVAVGEEPLATKVNYFIGRDPKKWRRNVPAFAKVRYKSVYPGIDLVYYGNNRAVEYDFDLAPGADASRIQFAVKGADALKIDSHGNLALSKGSSTMRFRAPLIYQAGSGKRTLVPGGYVMRDSSHVGFAVGKHDATQPLVIDPVLVYSTFLGGSGDDFADAIAVDGTGDAYVVGLTNSPNFPTATSTSGTANTPPLFTMFLTELDPTGTTLLFLDYFGSTDGNDGASAIALDSTGNAYVTGYTDAADFPVSPLGTAYQSTLSGTQDAFVTAFMADGSGLIYSTYLGGTASQIANSIAVDSANEAVITGATTSTDFPTSTGAFQTTVSTDQFGDAGQYAFVSKISADGTGLAYSTYLAGSTLNTAAICTGCFPYSEGMGVVTDATGIYVVGNTTTTDFPVTDGAFTTTYPGYYLSGVGFVSKFDTSGALSYSTYLGGQTSSYLSAITVDGSNSAYVTGYDIADDGFPLTPSTICDPTANVCNGAVIAKLLPDGSGLDFATYLNSGNDMQGQAIQLDGGNPIIVGSGNQFSLNNQIEGYSGNGDVILAEISSDGTTQVFATFLGGSQLEAAAQSLAIDGSRNVYVTGVTQSADFPVTQRAIQTLPGGRNDAFVTKIDLATSASAVTMAPWALDFGSVDQFTPSASQTTVLRNMGTAGLNLASFTMSNPDFSETDDCGVLPATIGSASFCTITITFTPSLIADETGTLTIADDAGDTPQIVQLAGTGTSGDSVGITVSPASLTFAASPVGTPNAPQVITFTNNGTSSVVVNAVQVTGNFVATSNSCGTVASHGSCNVRVGFTPTAAGAATGTVKFVNSTNGSQSVALSGSGIDFSTSPVSDSAAVENGGTATYQLNLSPSGGAFTRAISFTCNGAPAFATCSINPRSVTPGKQPAALTVIVKTSGPSAQARGISGTPRGFLAAWLPAQLAIFGVLIFVPRGRRRVKACSALMLTFMLLLLAGCAGVSTGAPASQVTPAGTYQLSVVGMSGRLQHVTTLTLTVK